MTNVCANCRYWGEVAHRGEPDKKECTRPDNYDKPDVFCAASEGSNWVVFLTAAEFGCNQWEAKDA